MSELRQDPLERRWVVAAPERARRPWVAPLSALRVDAEEEPCAFCPGQESRTRPQILMLKEDASALPWQVRVFPNYYPMLAVESAPERRAVGLCDAMGGVGAHEVVVETPDHRPDLGDLTVDEVALVVRAWRERVVDLYRDRRLRQVMVFKNRGALAGSTMSHAHSQLVGLPLVPARHRRHLASMRDHHRRSERSLVLDLARQELEHGTRVVRSAGGLLTFAPFASPFRYLLRIVPLTQRPFFCELGVEGIRALAEALRDAIRRLRLGLGDLPYNLCLFIEPNVRAEGWPGGYFDTLEKDFQWYVELIPRLAPQGGVEWGGELYVNSTLPEDAAAHLRQLDVVAWPSKEA